MTEHFHRSLPVLREGVGQSFPSYTLQFIAHNFLKFS
jgi:hypothetical protein